MRAELCGCALQRRGKRRLLKKTVYYFWKASTRRARGQNRSVTNETYGNVLVKGEERGRGTRCVRTVTLPAATRTRGGTDDASALGCEGYPATTHYFTKKKRRSGGNNMTDGPLPGDAAPQL